MTLNTHDGDVMIWFTVLRQASELNVGSTSRDVILVYIFRFHMCVTCVCCSRIEMWSTLH